MTAEADVPTDKPRKGGMLPLILGIVLAIAGGGAGFFAVQSGILGGGSNDSNETAEYPESHTKEPLILSFVAIDPLVISLPGRNGRNHLRFAAQLEVPPQYVAEVEAIRPRIIDVLNSYLRAVDIAELEDPTALVRLRGQMLRRVQVVAGEGRVRDLLIMEFVLS